MNIFIFISDAWGPINGGINCFNYDLTIACARAVKKNMDTVICCVVPNLSDEEKRTIKSEGIIPITLSKKGFESPEAARLISETIRKHNELQHYFPERCNTFCIGHDIYSGKLSKCLADECNGWNIVFHHMDYSSYYLFNNPNTSTYEEKIETQKRILCDADLVYAVGPKLKQSAKAITRRKKGLQTMEIIPGIAAFDAIEEIDCRFNPIVFGRVEENNQCVKQTALAIDAFAKAIALDEQLEVIGDDAKLSVIGYSNTNSQDLKKEVERLQTHAVEVAGKLCNIVPIAYKTNREELGTLICEASVAMMLSFHEGFGLVGYEAIAAGVPLILSENSGLYMFLKAENLHDKVYSVKIKGSTRNSGYSDSDLDAVAKALREIKNNEVNYKKKALDLRNILLAEKSKYSWDAVARGFIHKVLEQFKSELENESTVFYRPDQVTKLNSALREETCKVIGLELPSKNKIFTVEGKAALTSLYNFLQSHFIENYSIFIYNVQSGIDCNSICPDFINDCRAFFGKKRDYKGREFQYLLGERLNRTILILNDFPASLNADFGDLFDLLNKSNHNFRIFTVFETNSPISITPYITKNTPQKQTITIAEKPIPVGLTDEQKLMAKILSFRGKIGYSKKLINSICYGINWHNDKNNMPHMFENAANTEEALIKFGLIEEYSEFSYQNSSDYLPVITNFEVDKAVYALGIYQMGRFYSRCYHLNKHRNSQLQWGYFSCRCFSYAAELSKEIKEDIKKDYEAILITIRKQAMDVSDYQRYHTALQRFFEEYKKPDNPWIWYHLIHCESIFCPQEDTLKKAEVILNTEIPAIKINQGKKELHVQFIRLCAELEHELNNPHSLSNLITHIDKLSSDSKVGTAWEQCLSTLICMAIDREEYSYAIKYLDEYKKMTKSNDLYQQVIAVAMETNLIIAQYEENSDTDLSMALPTIAGAYKLARNRLRDYRAQGWTLGLWGECQILSGDQDGQNKLYRSMEHRRTSGERTKEYKVWLQRISKYNLQQKVRQILNEEIIRTKT